MYAEVNLLRALHNHPVLYEMTGFEIPEWISNAIRMWFLVLVSLILSDVNMVFVIS